MLRERKRAGAAVLLTTHQLRFADGLADRAIVLDEGAVADEGSWAEVASERRRAGGGRRRSGGGQETAGSRPSAPGGGCAIRHRHSVGASTSPTPRRSPRRLGAVAYGAPRSALAEVLRPHVEGYGPAAALAGLVPLARWGTYQGPVVFTVADVAFCSARRCRAAGWPCDASRSR